MRVPARVFGTEKIVQAMEKEVFDQAANVACLPGIVKYSYCMPDGHWGYGFPIGGVAAMDLDDGVITPGGIGYDINCGVRLIRTNLTLDEVAPRLKELVDALFHKIPVGPGRSSLMLKRDDFLGLAEQGSRWCLRNGFASADDLMLTEEGGCFEGADTTKVSDRAIERGHTQTGTAGPGMKGVPEAYKKVGQPVFIGGSMQTGSYILAGEKTADVSFYSTSHGSGRTMSRHKAQKMVKGAKLQRDMEHQGIYVRTTSLKGLAEEAGFAYKDIDEVAKSAEVAGLSRRVLKLRPIGNIKG